MSLKIAFGCACLMMSFVAAAAPAKDAPANSAKVTHAAGGVSVITHKLFLWKISQGWSVSLGAVNKEGYESAINLKNGATALSLFIEKSDTPNSVDLQERQLRSEKNKTVSRIKWNGVEWVIAEFEKPARETGRIMVVTFAATQKSGHLFSAMSETPKGQPVPDIKKVLSTLELK